MEHRKLSKGFWSKWQKCRESSDASSNRRRSHPSPMCMSNKEKTASPSPWTERVTWSFCKKLYGKHLNIRLQAGVTGGCRMVLLRTAQLWSRLFFTRSYQSGYAHQLASSFTILESVGFSFLGKSVTANLPWTTRKFRVSLGVTGPLLWHMEVLSSSELQPTFWREPS